MSQVTLRRSNFQIGALQIAIIVATVVTALIHFYKGVSVMNPGAQGGHFAGQAGGGHPGGGGHYGSGGPGGGRPGGGGPSILSYIPIPLSILFLLNGVAYLVLLIALYLPALRAYQRIVRWLLIALAILTIISFFLISGVRFNLLGYIDKPIEVLLVVLLLIDNWQSSRAKVS